MAEFGRIVWEGWFSLTLPDGWRHSQEDGVITICDEVHGVGAIQVSCVRRSKTAHPVPAEAIELAEMYAQERGWKLSQEEIATYRIDNSPAAEFIFRDDEPTFWHVWHIVEDKRVAFITYNCSPRDAEKELTARQEIIRSFKWEPLNSHHNAVSRTP
jgi:hypothetical protein